GTCGSRRRRTIASAIFTWWSQSKAPATKRRNQMPKDLKGIYPAVTTPFTADGSVALARVHENIARYNKLRVAGYVLNGSTGESVLLKWDEIEHVWEAARAAAAPGKILIAGTAAESTAETIEHTNRAAEIGCDIALVRTPHYFKPQMTPAALVEF